MKTTFALIISLCSFTLAAQEFVNGDFEINTAIAGQDYINLSADDFNGLMSNTTSFGTAPNVDIMTLDTYGPPQSGSWFVAITGGDTDMISLELTEALVMGNTYTINFYNKANASFLPHSIVLGLAGTADDVGEIIYTEAGSAAADWELRSFTFQAPSDGQFISVRSLGELGNWTILDNFSFSPATSINDLAAANIRLLQNPVGENLTLVADASVSPGTFSILAPNGALIRQESYTDIQTTELNVSELAAGIYILNIETIEGERGSLKFVKL